MIGPSIEVARCLGCRTSRLPREGPCARCGESRWEPHAIPSEAVVLAATELMVPPSGWEAPHRIALVEMAEGVRVLGRFEGPVPTPGAGVGVERDARGFVVRPR